MNVHIPGCGDVTIKDMGLLQDPCPPPATWDGSKKIKRRLDERDRLIYAPMCDVGGIVYDRDATFVEIPQAATAAAEAAAAAEDSDFNDPRAQLIAEMKKADLITDDGDIKGMGLLDEQTDVSFVPSPSLSPTSSLPSPSSPPSFSTNFLMFSLLSRV